MLGGWDRLARRRKTARAATPRATVIDLRFFRHGAQPLGWRKVRSSSPSNLLRTERLCNNRSDFMNTRTRNFKGRSKWPRRTQRAPKQKRITKPRNEEMSKRYFFFALWRFRAFVIAFFSSFSVFSVSSVAIYFDIRYSLFDIFSSC